MSNLKLVEIQIENFRKFRENFVLRLRSPAERALDYMVLAGPNGCGKTTILEAILLSLGRDDLIVRDVGAADRAASPRVSIDPTTRLVATLEDTNDGATHTIQRTNMGFQVRNPTMLQFNQVIEWDPFGGHPVPLPIEYISARRLPALVGPVQDVTRRGRPPADTEANRLWLFKDRLRKQQGRRVAGYRGPEPLDQLWLDKLNTYWRVFRDDGTTFAMTLVNPDDLDANDWDLFLYRGEERICSVDMMSSGEQEVIAMAVPFLTSAFDGLLLIDEPEQHLHPQWQGRVLRALRTLVPTSQVIVATHADDPWDDAKSWERQLLVDANDPRATWGTGEAQRHSDFLYQQESSSALVGLPLMN